MSPPEAPEPFPFACTPEAGLPGYLRVRTEGLPLRKAIWHGLAYLRKYRHPRRSAPPEEVAYFDRQRQLLRWLAGHGPDDGVRLALAGGLTWLRDGWQTFLSPEALAYLNGHAVVLGSLESPLSPRFAVPSFWPDYYRYNSDAALVSSFCRPEGGSTFAALATANEHCLDQGDAGLADTLALLDALGIAHSGARTTPGEKPFAIFERGGIRFGFYAACAGLNQPPRRSSGHAVEVIEGLTPPVQHPVDIGRIRSALEGMTAAGAQFKVVALHWGYRFEFYPCPDLVRVGREIVAAGADVVLGSHPHVVQPLEVCFVNGYEQRYRAAGAPGAALEARDGCVLSDPSGVPRKGLIAYSLGNLATAMYTLHCRTGLVASLRLGRDAATGRIDWHRPEMQFVHNVHRDPLTGQRRLTLVETYLRESERRGDRAGKLRALVGFLERHVMG